MAYKVIILYRLYMPSYFLGTFTEYPYQALVREVPHYGTRTTKRWYTEYQLSVAEVPPFGTRSTASRYRQITYSLIAPQCGQTPFAPIFCPQLPQR